MSMKSLSQLGSIKGKTALVRVDFNVPVLRGKVLDLTRIKSALPTIKFLHRRGVGKIILISHLGRPQGKELQSLSLKPMAKELEQLLRQPVGFSTLENLTKIGEGVVLIENIRFFKEEELNNKAFAQRLAGLADFYVNDAFSVCHHQGASLVGITKYLPSYAGLDLEQEVLYLSHLIKTAKKPSVAVIGGAKVKDKLPVIEFLAKKFDKILVGGVVANTFLKAIGVNVGQSLVENSLLVEARQIFRKNKKKIFLPLDLIVDVVGSKKKEHTLVDMGGVKNKHNVLDIGPLTTKFYSEIIKKSQTVFWAGTLGNTEESVYSHGTLSVGRVASSRARGKALVVIGGGDTASFFHKHKLWVDYYSTAGGALLRFLSGETLPALKALGYK